MSKIVEEGLNVKFGVLECHVKACNREIKELACHCIQVAIVTFNVCGPMKNISLGGIRYFFTFIGDYSRKMWVYALKIKSEYFDRFKEFKALVDKDVDCHIKVLQSKNGGE